MRTAWLLVLIMFVTAAGAQDTGANGATGAGGNGGGSGTSLAATTTGSNATTTNTDTTATPTETPMTTSATPTTTSATPTVTTAVPSAASGSATAVDAIASVTSSSGASASVFSSSSSTLSSSSSALSSKSGATSVSTTSSSSGSSSASLLNVLLFVGCAVGCVIGVAGIAYIGNKRREADKLAKSNGALRPVNAPRNNNHVPYKNMASPALDSLDEMARSRGPPAPSAVRAQPQLPPVDEELPDTRARNSTRDGIDYNDPNVDVLTPCSDIVTAQGMHTANSYSTIQSDDFSDMAPQSFGVHEGRQGGDSTMSSDSYYNGESEVYGGGYPSEVLSVNDMGQRHGTEASGAPNHQWSIDSSDSGDTIIHHESNQGMPSPIGGFSPVFSTVSRDTGSEFSTTLTQDTTSDYYNSSVERYSEESALEDKYRGTSLSSLNSIADGYQQAVLEDDDEQQQRDSSIVEASL